MQTLRNGSDGPTALELQSADMSERSGRGLHRHSERNQLRLELAQRDQEIAELKADRDRWAAICNASASSSQAVVDQNINLSREIAELKQYVQKLASDRATLSVEYDLIHDERYRLWAEVQCLKDHIKGVRNGEAP